MLLRKMFYKICFIAISLTLFLFQPLASQELESVTQEQRSVRGAVRDAETGELLPGVKVILTTPGGETKGAITDVEGKYSIETSGSEGELTFSFSGFKKVKETIGDREVINVSLRVSRAKEIIVTSLGQERERKAVSFSVQTVKGSQITTVKSQNLATNIDGKVAGVDISGLNPAVGTAPRITFRGSRSIQGNNQPLIIIDGVRADNFIPFSGSGYNVFGGDGVNLGGDDGLASINPDDIASMNVIRGATGAALYGGEAANGVIVISTKRGKVGKPEINISNYTTFSTPAYKPELQYKYTSTDPESKFSWGSEGGVNTASNYLDDFFKTGVSTITAVNIASGTDKVQFFGSYANTFSEGTIPNNEQMRHNLNLRASTMLFDKLRVEAKFTLINQNNRGVPGVGLYVNPLTGLYLFPRGLNFSDFTTFETPNTERSLNQQKWHEDEDIQQNPFWVQQRNVSTSERTRFLTFALAEYSFTDWLRLQLRGTMDRTNFTTQKNFFATTQGTIANANSGRYFQTSYISTLYYGDVLLNFDKEFGDFNLSATLGASIIDNNLDGIVIDSKLTGLHLPNYFTLNALRSGSQREEIYTKRQLQAMFFTVQASFRDMIFLEVTGRNDWASTLPIDGNSFFYPSVGLSIVFNEMLGLSEDIGLLKIRAAFAQVGNDVPPFLSNPTNKLDYLGNVQLNTTSPFTDLKPERSTNWEVGFDIEVLPGAFSFSGTYYRTNTENQLFTIDAPAGSGYTQFYVNAGDILNQGFEASFNYTPVRSAEDPNGFRWDGYLNASKNWNTILSLHKDIESFVVTPAQVNSYQASLEKDGSIGDIYSYLLKKDNQGRIVLDGNGKPQKDSDQNFVKVGNSNNQWILGLGNSFSFYGFNLSFLIDFRLGGQVISVTQAILDEYGVSKTTEDARTSGSVKGNFVNEDGQAVSEIPAVDYYSGIGGRAGVLGEYVYDASTIRVREISLGYNIPTDVIMGATNNVIKGISLSLVARNLLYFYKPAPFDSQVSGTASSSLPGVDVFLMPANTEFGFSVKLKL